MNIKKILALTLSLFFILASLSGCRKVGVDMSSGNTSDISSIVYGIVDIVENSSESDSSDVQSTANIDSDNTQSTVTGDKNTSSTSSDNSTSNESSSNNNYTDNIVSVGDGGNSGNSSNVDPEPPPTFETETDDGKTAYETAPDDNNSVITVNIAAGKSVIYKISRASNRILTINSPNAYVIYAGKRYEAENGKVSFFVESNQLSSEQIIFEIGNKGTQTESFTIVFTDLQGTWDNKEELTSIGEKITTSLEEGNEVGYWYKHTATQKGKIRFYLLSGTDVGVLLVTNNRNSAQRSTEEDIKTDNIGSYIVLDVKQGDEIVINVGAKANDTSKYPAVQIEWIVKYE